MRNIINQNKAYLLGFGLLFSIALFFQISFGKEACFLFVNQHHSVLGDKLFPYITYFGDGATVIIIAIVLLFFSYRHAILLGSTYLISSQITQVLKRTVFSETLRPSKYFEQLQDLHFVEGVELHKMMSFPSGHTTSIFALMTFFAIITKNKNWSVVYLLIACLGAYSRMYLSQHFLEDLLAGSFIGLVSTFLLMSIIPTFKWYQSISEDARMLKKNN